VIKESVRKRNSEGWKIIYMRYSDEALFHPVCREVFERFAVHTRGIGMELLRLLSEGMGLQPDYFEGDLGSGNMTMNLNHYPPCVDPNAVGLPPHCDRNLLSLLIPSTVPGLQFSYKGNWYTVETMPNAYIVNFGLPLQVIDHFNIFPKNICSVDSNHHQVE
jgi:isopenicillin N synthase-like dioxygenase